MSPATSTSNNVVAVAAAVDSAPTTREVIVPGEGASIQELRAAVEAFDHLLDDPTVEPDKQLRLEEEIKGMNAQIRVLRMKQREELEKKREAEEVKKREEEEAQRKREEEEANKKRGEEEAAKERAKYKLGPAPVQ